MGSVALPTPKKNPWIETPLIESSTLSRAAGCRIFLKLENLQPSSSFKSRGIGNLVLQSIKAQQASTDDRPLHFYASSGGNAGLACVTAAVALGYRSTIAVPTSTEESMVARLRAAGATDVIVHGPNFFVADRYLREVMMPKSEAMGERPVYVPPFDNPLIWDGASTLIPEIKKQMPDGEVPDAIVCSVGGGGLFAGIMQGVEEAGWSTRVLAVETQGADSLAKAVEKRELVAMDEITSVAKSLGAPTVAQRALDYALQPNASNLVIEDAEACASCWRFVDDERILVEPACGASVALAYDGRLKRYLKSFCSESKVVIVVCGGSRIDLKMLDEYKKRFGARAKELGLSRCEDVPTAEVFPESTGTGTTAAGGACIKAAIQHLPPGRRTGLEIVSALVEVRERPRKSRAPLET